MEKEIETLKKQLDKTFDLLERGVYDEDTFFKRNSTIKAKIKEHRQSLETLLEQKAMEEQALFIENNFIPTVRSVVSGYDTIDNASMKNELLKSVISRMEYIKETRNMRGKRDTDNFELTIYPLIPHK